MSDLILDSIKSIDIIPDTKDLKCAPSQTFTDGSCMPLPLLVYMAQAYNDDLPNNKIKLSHTLETLNPQKYKRYLVKEFKSRLNDICENQSCWLKQRFMQKLNKKIKDYAITKIFRPKGPQGQFDWLNTHNINTVMKQYEDKYRDFSFLGAVPIDFDDLYRPMGLKEFSLDDQIHNGKTKIGIVFNLDEHYKSGSHWVAMYTDVNKGQIYFSDSYGIEPERRIRKLMRRFAKIIKHKVNNLDVRHNKTRHQYGGSECGVYSLNFILRLLNGDTFDKIISKPISDEAVNRCRDVYFH